MFGCWIVTYDIIMIYVYNMYISGYCTWIFGHYPSSWICKCMCEWFLIGIWYAVTLILGYRGNGTSTSRVFPGIVGGLWLGLIYIVSSFFPLSIMIVHKWVIPLASQSFCHKCCHKCCNIPSSKLRYANSSICRSFPSGFQIASPYRKWWIWWIHRKVTPPQVVCFT